MAYTNHSPLEHSPSDHHWLLQTQSLFSLYIPGFFEHLQLWSILENHDTWLTFSETPSTLSWFSYLSNLLSVFIDKPESYPRNLFSVFLSWFYALSLAFNYHLFPGGSVVKNLPAVQEMWARPLGWEDPLEKEMASHQSILTWEIPWTEEPSWL